MKIALLGATGNVGSHVLKQAVDEGHTVVAYARRPEAVARLAGVTVIKGELDDTVEMARAIEGADALIVSLTGSARDTGFNQRTLPGIINAAGDGGVGRLIFVSAFGAGDTAEKASGFARLAYRTVLKGFFDDKAKAERLLPKSGLNWTVVFPVNLKEAPTLDTTTVKLLSEVSKIPGLPTLPFGNIAKALIEVATSAKYEGQRVVVTTPKGWKPV